MRPFQLFARGRAFDVDAFIAATGFRCDRVFHRGEPEGSRGFINDASGFNRWLGDESKLSLAQQFELAGRFMNENREALSQLTAWPGLELATIVLSPQANVSRSTVSTKVYTFPVDLVQTCAALGLELGIAVRLNWLEEAE